jgi:hypothetical protein
MTGKELERLLSTHTPRSAAELDGIGRALRDAGLVPSGARGPHAPDFNADHVAAFLIAAAATPIIAEAATTAKTYAALKSLRTPFAKAKTFGEALAAALIDIHNARDVDAVELNRTWPCASIRIKNGREFVYGHVSRNDRAGIVVYPFHEVTRITTGLLSMVALEIAGIETPVGWKDD